MGNPIRFHLDEHMDPAIASALRRANIDVTTTQDQELSGEPDNVHFARAMREERIIITDDVDFLSLAQTTANHPGIVFCRRTRHSIGDIVRFLVLLHGVCDAEDMVGRVEFP